MPYDSSSGSGGDSLGSSASDSLMSGDLSNSNTSLGSHNSGSSGFYMGIWVWCLVGAVCCGAITLFNGVKKPKKKKATKKKAAPAPAPEPAAPAEEPVVLEPLLVPQLMPIATTSYSAPQYSVVAAPQYAPQYGYAGVPQFVETAAPTAYPGTVSYVAPGQTV